MTTPDKAQQPQLDDLELTDEDLDQVSGGVVPWNSLNAAGVDGDLEGKSLEVSRREFG